MEKARTTRATRDSKAMPSKRNKLAFERTYSLSELAKITHGLEPESMEDKWFIFAEGDWLFLHRSWTGICIYSARFHVSLDGATVTEAWVNRDEEQYKATDDAYDAQMLGYLIDRLLLHREVPFPHRERLAPEKAHLLEHVVVGSIGPKPK